MNFGVSTDEAEAQRIIDAGIEGGINFIDTADVYARGVSEEMTGKALAGQRPSRERTERGPGPPRASPTWAKGPQRPGCAGTDLYPRAGKNT